MLVEGERLPQNDLDSFRAGVLNLFLTADRSTLDNFTADHPGSAVELASGGGERGGGKVCGSLFYEMP